MELAQKILINIALILCIVNIVIITIKTYKFNKECDIIIEELKQKRNKIIEDIENCKKKLKN